MYINKIVSVEKEYRLKILTSDCFAHYTVTQLFLEKKKDLYRREGKVVAAACWTKLLQLLAARALSILHLDDWKNRMKSTYSSMLVSFPLSILTHAGSEPGTAVSAVWYYYIYETSSQFFLYTNLVLHPACCPPSVVQAVYT